MGNSQTNSIEYGLKNVYFAKITAVSDTGVPTYATPKQLLGAVTLSMNPNGNTNIFYADNIAYYTSTANTGYQGDLEIALLSDDFRKDILGETADKNSLLTESADAIPSEFALLFQFEGDVNAKRHILYRCSATRPNIESSTVQESITPKTSKLSITAMPRKDGKHITKASVTSDNKTVYDSWFTEVKEPDFTV